MSARFGHGLVIGTFYPLHAGHVALGRAALSRCDRVTLEVLGGSTESIPVPLRAQWLEEELPMARIATVVDDAEIDFDSIAAWDHHTAVIRSLLDPADGPVEAVFTSDAYGQELARRLGAEWVQVDPGRTTLPVSSTAVRSDVPGYWWALPAPVRQHLAKRIVVVGAQPEAVSVLARDLAGHFGVPCVLAHDRVDDLARRSPRPLLICDSVAPTTPIPSLYLLSGDEIPVITDGSPDRKDAHSETTGWSRAELDQQPIPWLEVSGTREARLEAGVRAVEEVLAAGWGLAPSLEQQQAARRAADTPPLPGSSV